MVRRGRVLSGTGTVIMAHVINPVSSVLWLLAVGVASGTVGVGSAGGIVVVVCGGSYRREYAVVAVGEGFLDETEPADPDCDDDE